MRWRLLILHLLFSAASSFCGCSLFFSSDGARGGPAFASQLYTRPRLFFCVAAVRFSGACDETMGVGFLGFEALHYAGLGPGCWEGRTADWVRECVYGGVWGGVSGARGGSAVGSAVEGSCYGFERHMFISTCSQKDLKIVQMPTRLCSINPHNLSIRSCEDSMCRCGEDGDRKRGGR